MGTIVGDTSMKVAYKNGRTIGTVEEYFIGRLKIGDCFAFAGMTLELLQVKGLTAYVQAAKRAKMVIPSWQGGRMSLSSEVSEILRVEMGRLQGPVQGPEHESLQPMLAIQEERSMIPAKGQLLIEKLGDKEGTHVFIYPFEGRMVNEGLAMLIAYRIASMQSMSISVAMNDYGFELLSNQDIPIEDALEENVLGTESLLSDITASCNMSEMSRRKFRDIAIISGLMFRGYPGQAVKERHLHSSASLFYEVFSDYDPDNLLLQQAYEEVLYSELDAQRLREALERMQRQEVCLIHLHEISPFSFPITIDRLRENLSNESIEKRVERLLAERKQEV